jgi:hypothetical protein
MIYDQACRYVGHPWHTLHDKQDAQVNLFVHKTRRFWSALSNCRPTILLSAYQPSWARSPCTTHNLYAASNYFANLRYICRYLHSSLSPSLALNLLIPSVQRSTFLLPTGAQLYGCRRRATLLSSRPPPFPPQWVSSHGPVAADRPDRRSATHQHADDADQRFCR